MAPITYRTHAHVSFVDFSPAFNTSSWTPASTSELETCPLGHRSVNWPPTKSLESSLYTEMLSDNVVVNTAALEGCVLIAVLCVHQWNDTALQQFQAICWWHDPGDPRFPSLMINVGKTKELILNHADPLPSLILCDQTVDVDFYM